MKQEHRDIQYQIKLRFNMQSMTWMHEEEMSVSSLHQHKIDISPVECDLKGWTFRNVHLHNFFSQLFKIWQKNIAFGIIVICLLW